MKHTKRNRILSFLLSFTLLLGMFPMTSSVFAEKSDDEIYNSCCDESKLNLAEPVKTDKSENALTKKQGNHNLRYNSSYHLFTEQSDQSDPRHWEEKNIPDGTYTLKTPEEIGYTYDVDDGRMFLGWSAIEQVFPLNLQNDPPTEDDFITSVTFTPEDTETKEVYAVWADDDNKDGVLDCMEEKYILKFDRNTAAIGKSDTDENFKPNYRYYRKNEEVMHIDEGCFGLTLPENCGFYGYTAEPYPVLKTDAVEIPETITKLKMDSDKTVYYLWAEDLNADTIPDCSEWIDLMYEAPGAENVPESGKKMYYFTGYGFDATVSNQVPKKDGYIFESWEVSSPIKGIIAECPPGGSFTVPANNRKFVLRAKWSYDYYNEGINTVMKIDSFNAWHNDYIETTTKYDKGYARLEYNEGTSMLPIRYIAEVSGLKVDWDESTTTVTITNPNDNSSLVATLNNTNMEKHFSDGHIEEINAPKPFYYNNIYALSGPTRFICETLGLYVKYKSLPSGEYVAISNKKDVNFEDLINKAIDEGLSLL